MKKINQEIEWLKVDHPKIFQAPTPIDTPLDTAKQTPI